jgi:hypothetical protein
MADTDDASGVGLGTIEGVGVAGAPGVGSGVEGVAEGDEDDASSVNEPAAKTVSRASCPLFGPARFDAKATADTA